MPGSRGTSAFRRVQVCRPLAGAERRCGRVGLPPGSALAFPSAGQVRAGARGGGGSGGGGGYFARRAGGGGMGLSRVRAVFFDLDNTLIDTAGASRKGMLEVIKLLQSKYHYKEEAEIICNKVQVKLSKECFHPSNTCITDLRTSHWEEAIQETKGGAANRKLAEECYFLWKSTRLQHMTLAEEVKAMLTELRKEVRLLLLTNGERQTQREKIEACACQSYFDAIVVGGEQKEEKPAPSIFYYSCDLLGVQPGDCVMVGDTLETDIQGGLNAGLKATVWINKNGMVPLKSSPTPHYIVSSVLELPALLHSIDCKVSVST
ncbi:N-acylneuraminate-9-phosphatase-like [Ovis canadensis]|uniref:N-acylneuraminate-9-phosphatase-like n=1 Tax=Ovis canadensis TaxID=37174 RepID=UPI0037505523